VDWEFFLRGVKAPLLFFIFFFLAVFLRRRKR
jgi:hypothetical protein